jgi:hypothetical protein
MATFERTTSGATMEMRLAEGVTPVSTRDELASADPDGELVSRAKTDAEEFLALYERYFTRVLGCA